MLIDLHAHSRASDGTDSPTDVMRAAAAAGLDVIALTDHDTTRGWDEAAAAALTAGVALVRGTEVSCSASGISVHLLSYLQDPEHPVLVAEMAAAREARHARARRIVGRLARDMTLTWDDVLAQVGSGATVGRPHIADALVARGHVSDRSAAFERLLATRSPYYVPYDAPDAVAMVRAVRAAGGVPVFAHPRASARGRVVADAVIEEMADAGLAGLEVDHRDHTDDARRRLREIATSLGLFETGSSDYHGSGKPNRLAENVTGADVFEQIEEQGHLPVVRP